MYACHDFYLHTNCSKRRKFAHSKEKLLTKIKFAQSKNLLKKFAHSRNLLTEFACSTEKLLTMINLAGSDGSTRWLNVSHQANRSTAGAHHSTVSVITAGTCWAGPSRGGFFRACPRKKNNIQVSEFPSGPTNRLVNQFRFSDLTRFFLIAVRHRS